MDEGHDRSYDHNAGTDPEGLQALIDSPVRVIRSGNHTNRLSRHR
jgi:hypothetical protein